MGRLSRSGWCAGLSLAIALTVLAAPQNAPAAFYYWLATADGDPTVPTNWSPNGVPGTSDEGRFTDTGPVVVTIPEAGWNLKYIGFSGSPATASTTLGVIPDYTFTGPGLITISNGNIDTFLGQTGTVTFNNTGGLDMTRGSPIYAASDAASGGNSSIVINTPTFRMGLTTSSGTPALNAWGGDITIYPAIDYSASGINRALTLSPNAGKTISILGGINVGDAGTKLTSVNARGQAGGKTLLGSISATWTNTLNVRESDIVLIGNTYGVPGDLVNTTGYTGTYPSNLSGTGALMLSNSAIPGGLNIAENIFLAARTSTATPHIVNLSGHNILSGTLGSDGGAVGDTANTLEARGVAAGDLFELSGTIARTTWTSGLGHLHLTGAGDGLIAGTITSTVIVSSHASATGDGGFWAVVKSGRGTWTLSGANTYTGVTTINEGTLSLGATGSIANSSSIEIKSGATFDVSGLPGAFTLAPAQTITGAGTIAGSLTAGSGNVISPGDSIGTLTIAGDLNLSPGGATLNLDLTNNPQGANDKLAVQGALSVAAPTNLVVNQINGALVGGTYRLIDYVGPALNTANFNLTGVVLTPRQTSATLTSVANQLNLHVVGDQATLTWAGDGATNPWDVGVTADWTGAPPPAFDNRFYDADNVVFSDTGSNTPPVTVAGAVAPGSMTFNHSAGHDYTLAGGNISVFNSLTATGSGNIILANTDFSAPSIALTGTGSLAIANHGAFAVASIALNDNSLIVNRADAAFTLSSALSGAGTLQKQGPNALVVAGNNTAHTGQMLVSAGTLYTTDHAALGAGGSLDSGVVVADGATLDVANGDVWDFSGTEAVAISGSGANGAGALAVTVRTDDLGTLVDTNGHVNKIILNADAKIAAIGVGGDTPARSILWVDGPGAAIQGNGHNLSVVIDAAGNSGSEIDFLGVGDMNVNNLDISGGGALYLGHDTRILGPTGAITLQDLSRLGLYGHLYQGAFTGLVDKPIVVAGSVNGSGLELYRGSAALASPISMQGNLEVSTYPRDNGFSTLTLTGPLTGPGSLAMHTDGTSTTNRRGLVELLSDGNTYAGTTTIGGGGGLAQLNPARDRSYLSIGNGGTTGSLPPGDVINNYVLRFNKVGTFAVPNNISGSGGDVEFTAPGAVVSMTGFNTYTGWTRIQAGTVKINGLHTGGGRYVVSGGATLDLTSVITPPVTLSELFVEDNAAFSFRLNTPSSTSDDAIIVTGALDLSAVTAITLNVTSTGGPLLADGAYLLAAGSTLAPPAAAPTLTFVGPNPPETVSLAFSPCTNAVYLLVGTARLPACGPDIEPLGGDGDVDLDDYLAMFISPIACFSGPAVPYPLGCEAYDLDVDGDVDLTEFGIWQSCFAGAGIQAERPRCTGVLIP